MPHSAILVAGPELASYGFPNGHPFGVDRYGAFMSEVERSSRFASLQLLAPRQATRAELEYFHTPAYLDRVHALSERGSGFLDAGDTPAFDRTMDRIAAKPYVSPYAMATIRAAQGDVDAAVALLQTAFEEGVAALPYVGIDPRLDPLRADPRFGDLLRRIG